MTTVYPFEKKKHQFTEKEIEIIKNALVLLQTILKQYDTVNREVDELIEKL